MRKSVIICLFVLVTVILFSQNESVEWNITGAGARAAGMGGAFIGVADDATAIVWNPAGLSQLERPEASFVMRNISTNHKYESDRTDEFKQNHFILNFLSAAYPIKAGSSKIVGALAIQNQLDMYYYIEDEVDDYKEESIGGASTFTLGCGTNVVPVLSLGATGNIWIGKWNITRIYTYGGEAKIESEFSGFNFSAGMMLDLNNLDNPFPLKIGANFKSPFDLTISWTNGEEWIIQMPMMLGIGASIRIGEMFTISTDYEMRSYKDKEIDTGVDPEPAKYLYDLNQFRIGTEYLIVSDFAVIPIRLGFFTDPTLLSYINQDNDVDQIKGNGLSIGSGLIFGKFSFDVSATISGWEIDFGNGIKESNYRSVIGLSGIIYFG